MISEERLRQAAGAAVLALADSLPEPEECQHEFSPGFEQKMRKVLRRGNHPTVYRRLRRAACLSANGLRGPIITSSVVNGQVKIILQDIPSQRFRKDIKRVTRLKRKSIPSKSLSKLQLGTILLLGGSIHQRTPWNLSCSFSRVIWNRRWFK